MPSYTQLLCSKVWVYRSIHYFSWGRTGLVVRASDSGSGDPVRSSAGSVCCFLEQDTFAPQKVLVIPRNRWLRLNMTEKLFTGTLNRNQNKNKIIFLICALKRRLWVFVRGGSNVSTIYVLSKKKKKKNI